MRDELTTPGGHYDMPRMLRGATAAAADDDDDGVQLRHRSLARTDGFV
jgi:hypothetical protein